MFIFVLTFFQRKTKIMDKKMKLALLALLGFSTACSTVKSGSKSKEQEATEIEQPATIVMYGVRPPVQGDKAGDIQEKPLTAAPASDVAAPVLDEVQSGSGR